MAVQALRHVDIDEVRSAVGPAAFQRGKRYAGDDRVLSIEWDAVDDVLTATVRGQGEIYTSDIYFGPDADGSMEFLGGACTCPVSMDCKHVVAAVLYATRAPATYHEEATGWQQSLFELIDSAPDSALASADGRPLAIELDLSRTGASDPVLSARVLRRGDRGWVYGGLSWTDLRWQRNAGHDPDHLQLLQKFQVQHVGQTRFGYGSRTELTIDLAAFDSSLWALLEEAERVGVRLLNKAKNRKEIPPVARAELCLDVTRSGDGGLRLSPRLRVDGADDAVPLGFLGTSGHGVVYAESEDERRRGQLALARLAAPAAAPLRRMTLAGSDIEVPPDAVERFRTEMWPRLRHAADITSSDGSFVPPTISEPTLVVSAIYGDTHRLDVTLEWAYAIGPVQHREQVDADPPAAHRNGVAEQRLLDSLDVDLEQCWLLAYDGKLAPSLHLSGLDTMRFTTEALPLLRDEPGVEVEVVGEPADFREVGDSLVVGLSTAEVSGDTDWFDLGITIEAEGRELPFETVFRALASDQTHLLLDDGAYFSLLKPELQSLRSLIEEARALHDRPSESLRISRYQVDLWDELSALGVVRRQAQAWEWQVDALRNLDGVAPVELPAGLTAELRRYQRDGFDWLSFLWDFGLGGILADDMGLGKTVQTLALMCRAHEADADLPPFLVIAPTSVVPNWAAEATRFAPDLRVAAVSDTMRRSGRSIGEVVGDAEVVVTSYTLFRLEAEAYHSVPWAGLVLDEAQHTKNHRSKIYGCIRKSPAPFKLAITGTPMENNLMELWSLLSITAPGLFPNPKRFNEMYARPIENQRNDERLDRLRRRIRPLVKRRTKELVADDLPAKQEQLLEVQLHSKHRKVYETRLQRERQKVLGLIDDFDRNRFTILRSITLLRQLALHPGLVEPELAAVPCAKLDGLVEQMAEVIEGGHRALVFSQFTGFLGLVRERLEAEGVEYCYLDGRTRKRDAVIDRFKSGSAPMFLISLKAGGFGLNLTEADYCFLLDPWWNPATEAQAVDRTHRIGQTRNVMVYRLIAQDTIEAKVMALKARKADLFNGVMDDGDLFSGGLDVDDISALFSTDTD